MVALLTGLSNLGKTSPTMIAITYYSQVEPGEIQPGLQTFSTYSTWGTSGLHGVNRIHVSVAHTDPEQLGICP